ncbi:MAG: hypothetical protein U0350_11740 [Caldilineaceae bacterium]
MTGEPQPNPKQPTNPNWLQRQLRRGRNQQAGDTITTQVGGHIEGANIVGSKNVIQIGTLQIPMYLTVIIAGCAGIIALIAVVNTLWPFFQPVARMTGQYNIAIARFGEEDAQGRVRTTKDGLVLSKWVYDTLKKQYTENLDLASLGNVQIWSDTPDIPGKNITFGAIMGDTPAAREAAADQLANKVGAHMVIYGYLQRAMDPSSLVLQFYIAPKLQPEVRGVLGGGYMLGEPIPIPHDFNVNNPLSNVAIGNDLKTRTAALSYLTAGLTFSLLGRSKEALAIFHAAEKGLPDWQDNADAGKEILYFFISREALFLKQDKDAETAARKALSINPHYVRAEIVLGSVYALRAQRLPPEAQLKEPSDLAQALTTYAKAVDLAGQTQDLLMQSIAQLALASALRSEAQVYYVTKDLAKANATYAKAIADLQPLIPRLTTTQQYRLLGQAYAYLGIAYFQQSDVYRQQGNRANQKQQLEQARTAFANCTEQEKNAPLDQLLKTEIIAKVCQPQQINVENALHQAAGGG